MAVEKVQENEKRLQNGRDEWKNMAKQLQQDAMGFAGYGAGGDDPGGEYADSICPVDSPANPRGRRQQGERDDEPIEILI